MIRVSFQPSIFDFIVNVIQRVSDMLQPPDAKRATGLLQILNVQLYIKLEKQFRGGKGTKKYLNLSTKQQTHY